MGIRLKHTLASTETKTDFNVRVRELAVSWPHCPSHRSVQHHMERSSLSLQLLQWEHRTWEDGQTPRPALWAALWELLLWYHIMGITEESGGLNYWEADWQRSREGLVTTSTWFLADQIHTCSAHVVIPSSDFVYLQNQFRAALWLGNSTGVQMCPIWILEEDFADPKTWLVYSQAKSLIRALPMAEGVFEPHLIQGLAATPGSSLA